MRTVLIVSVAGAVFVIAGFFALRAVRQTCCLCELEQIDGAKQAWATQYHKTTNDTRTWEDLQPMVFPGRKHKALDFRCPKGGTYTIGRVGEVPTCSIGGFGHSLP